MARSTVQLFRQSLNSLTQGVLVLEPSGTCLFANEAAGQILRSTPRKMVGKDICTIVHNPLAEGQSRCPRDILEPARTSQPRFRIPEVFWVSGAIPVWVEYSAMPILLDGVVDAVVLSFTPAEHTDAHEELVSSHALYEAVFQTIMDALLVVNEECVVQEANTAARALFKQNSLNGKQLLSLIPDENMKAWRSVIGVRNSEYAEAVLPLVRNGEQLFIAVRQTADILSGSSLLILRDVTSSHQDELARNQFIAVAGHELKTPLTVIKSYNQLLQRKVARIADAGLERYTSTIDEKVEYLTQLINSMFDVIKLGAGKLKFRDELLDPNAELKSIVQQLRKTEVEHSIRFRGHSKHSIEFDKQWFFQVITNLVTNAAKYSPEKTAITVTLSEKNGQVCCSVRDQGYGIPQEEIERVFEPYYRSSGVKTARQPGLGIGLYFVKQIIQHYHGRIRIASSVGKGTTCSFWLPARQPLQPPGHLQ